MTVPKRSPALERGHRALRKGRVSAPHHVYLVTAVTRDRQRYFDDFAVGCAAAGSFESTDTLGDCRLWAWVLMPDHAHWLLQLGSSETLAGIVNRLKSASARRANSVLGREGPLWARGFHDRGLRHDEDTASVARYIVANPWRAGLVNRVADWPFWNAAWL
jgi:REP element-mobilizing transposase RayT